MAGDRSTIHNTPQSRYYFALVKRKRWRRTAPDPGIDQESGIPGSMDASFVYENAVQYEPYTPHGNVVSLYDSLGKARRYAGADGKVLGFNVDEIAEVVLDDGTPDARQRRFEEAERLMLYWTEECERRRSLL